MSVADIVYGVSLDSCRHRIRASKSTRKRSNSSPAPRRTNSRRPGRAVPDDPVHTFTERIAPELIADLEKILVPENREGSDLRRYAATLDASGAKQVHWVPQQHGIGRLYAHDGVSLVNLKRNVRRMLCEPSMLDIDIVNAHPTILLQLARREDWPRSTLHRYIFDRENTLASIDTDRTTAKRLVLKMIFNGSPGRYKRQKFIRDLHEELQQMRDLAWSHYSEIREVIESLGRTHSKASCLSFLLMQNERAVLDATVEYLTSADWQVAALAYDGLMVYRRDDVAEPDFAALSRHVKAKTDFDLGFCVKPWVD